MPERQIEHSTSLREFAPAFLAAQMAITAVIKDQTGKIETTGGKGYEYQFANLAQVIEQVKPHLNANGISFIQGPGNISDGATVTTMLLHTSGEWMSCTVFIPVGKLGAQAMGSAITYAKRYGLQSMCGLPGEDDDAKKASETYQPRGEKGKKEKRITMPASDYHALKQAIDDAPDEMTLREAYTKAYLAAQSFGDADAQTGFTDAKDDRKRALAEAGGTQASAAPAIDPGPPAPGEYPT